MIEQYTKMIDDSDSDFEGSSSFSGEEEEETQLPDAPANEDDDFITLKRANHKLSDDESSSSGSGSEGELDHDEANADPLTKASYLAANLSKRKQKLSRSKKILLQGGQSQRILFDPDTGEGKPVYAIADGDEYILERGGVGGVMRDAEGYAEEGRKEMGDVRERDWEEAREKRREGKRRRKERERVCPLSCMVGVC